jgi:hypothetical protein
MRSVSTRPGHRRSRAHRTGVVASRRTHCDIGSHPMPRKLRWHRVINRTSRPPKQAPGIAALDDVAAKKVPALRRTATPPPAISRSRIQPFAARSSEASSLSLLRVPSANG